MVRRGRGPRRVGTPAPARPAGPCPQTARPGPGGANTCGPAGPASPPRRPRRPPGPASASRRPGRGAEGRFASAAPHCSRSRRRPRRPGRTVAVRRTRSRPAPHPLAPPVSPAGAPTDPPATGQSAARPGSPRPVRSALARGKARSAAAGSGPAAPRPPGPTAPGRAGPGGQPGAAAVRGSGGEGYSAPFGVSFRFLSFSFFFFRFLSFLPPVTGGEQLHGAIPPPCRRVTHRASLPSPIGTASPRAAGLRRAPAEHPGAGRRGGTRPRGGAPRPPDPSKGSAPPRRGERAHRRRGGGSRARYFVVIKILPPRRARIGAEARPRGAGRARRAEILAEVTPAAAPALPGGWPAGFGAGLPAAPGQLLLCLWECSGSGCVELEAKKMDLELTKLCHGGN
ncbi:uncharacterized protein LJ206_005819 [Theristicus caerulescens]